MTNDLAGSAGPHVFVESLDTMVVSDDDQAHLSKSLRMRDGDALTASDGRGNWRTALFGSTGSLEATGEIQTVAERATPLTIAFALVKGNKPELVIQKLTELGVDQIVVLSAERSVVRWDDDKVHKASGRWERIAREASMQSHRVRLPEVRSLVPAGEWLARPEVAITHFGGEQISARHSSLAIGPEGGWSDSELAVAGARVSLGATVLRAETAAIAAATLLTAAAGTY